jgi:endonuclease YncB( thermonuclease family)
MKRILTTISVTALVIGSFIAEAAGRTLVVKKVHSGDVIEFEGGWTTRLSGVDAPDPDEPLGQAVLQFTRQELEGQRIAGMTYTLDNTAAGIVYDDEGYPFMLIEYGQDYGIDFNALLIRKGFARVDTTWLPPYLEHYRTLEQQAREEGLGLWQTGEK